MDDKEMVPLVSVITSILLGLYVGVFIGEANTMYECEKDKTVTIKGAFWKGETKYSCVNRQAKGGE